ncbi:Activator of Hsp90 ATPase 1 family protein [Beutenbergia cavernae DSM 12333]|uniref:Activator of Hsp90 ATPase 1 family protein n=1 Tax=Beutenbergia cavernae (strain ATCC BAA-8 / DSM 12333 / CCUG 43141 / JCM 11478 / NBRC 16432 / NCIMB 13614 / HKI 0122) TaxID=471853 RepID=C5C0D7_BEUC1|nr:SRPBCC domain-containing protein [Beutenbergia cavernae]ACQ79323.1 Activator of Hsp90 ATPase 1 family protein [Beutenbergia cavernae DSM 12333]
MTSTPVHADIASRIAAEPALATLSGGDDAWVLTLERTLSHSRERVWAMLTDPTQQARWSPVVTDRLLDAVGPARSRENPGDDDVAADVLRCDPPHELVHHWGDDVLHWTLAPAGEGATRLTLRQRFADRAMASSMAAGWHVCLGALGAAADDVPGAERVVGQRATDYGWAQLRDEYEASFRTAPLVRSAPPVMRTSILVRRPARDVFGLFTDPGLTTLVWFTHSTGPVQPGARLTWTWEMFDLHVPVRVHEVVPDRRILLEWGDDGATTHVEWTFSADDDGATRVEIVERGFVGTADEMVAAALDSTIGFTQVLTAAKAYLEHGVRVAVVADH